MIETKIAVIGALEDEITSIKQLTTNLKTIVYKNFVFHECELNGRPIVLCKIGVGKVFAAMTLQRLIDSYTISHIILTGVAGGLNPNYEIGDVVVAKDCVQHDLDTTGLGIPLGTIPYTTHRFFETDHQLRKLALQTKLPHRVHEGRILTGDQFFTKSHFHKSQLAISELQGDAIEMEGAAIAMVATFNHIPFIILRTISDKADSQAHINFQEFLPQVVQNSLDMVVHIVSNL